MDAHIHASADGTILYDADTVPQVDHAWFDPAWWVAQGALCERGGGRGGVSVIDTPAGAGVLRHYRRGGMVANLLGDRYLWTGRERTRCFAEFRLLAQMHAWRLPVPVPLAARYCRGGMHYTADLITRLIEDAHTLAECLAAGSLDAELAQRCGTLIARFHRRGIWHADLNAHNLLVTPSDIMMIDFDRGERRSPARAWRDANLRRLRRSLLKLGAARDGEEAFEHDVWTPLMRGYSQAMEQSS